MTTATVTVVVVPREQFSVARQSLESIYQHTEHLFELVYIDGNSPRQLRDYLRQQSRERGFTLLRSEHYLSPNRARNWALQHASGDYVVFVDNDLLVSPGWLDRLVDCAEQTAAWAVGPLYLEGDPAAEIIHMAGGTYEFHGESPRRRFFTSHLLQKHHLSALEQPLARAACDFVEFHCMLVRRELFDSDRLGPLDENLLNTREHLDLCLQIRAAGGSVYFEPRSLVTYRSPPPLAASDVPFFMLRWSEDWTRRSLDHFIDKYGLDASYRQRSVIATARRGIVFEPLTQAAKRVVGQRGARLLHGAISRAERLLNRLVIRHRRGAAVAQPAD